MVKNKAAIQLKAGLIPISQAPLIEPRFINILINIYDSKTIRH